MSVLEAATTERRRAGASRIVSVSVVVPVSDGCDDLTEVYWTHAEVLRRMGRSFEFVFVIDGGVERAGEPLRSLQRAGEPLRVLQLPRMFGEAMALRVGFEAARAEVIVTISAYLQVTPDGLRHVLEVLDEGADVVLGRREPRGDPLFNRLQHQAFHFLTRRLIGSPFHDISCGLKAIRRHVTREVHLYGDVYRFLPLLAYHRGFRVVETPVAPHVRNRRTRIYRPGVYLRRLLDILTVAFLFKFIGKPLRFFGLIGAGLLGAGFVISLTLVVQRTFEATALADRPLLLLGVLLMVLGIQVGSVGLLGEMIVFTHARRIRDYAIAKILK
jgi:glycosyltransferase involved in cell wall biosynthesis